ncbi:MAG: L,D-transpeptidase family protein [Caulobacterales bacterium]
MFKFASRLGAGTLLAALLVAPAPLCAQTAPAPPPLSPQDGAAIAAAWQAASEIAGAPSLAAALELLAGPDAAARRQADATLTLAAQSLALAEHGTVQNPRAVDKDWALRAPYDAVADFEAARVQGRIADWAAALPRRDGAYRALLDERARYAAILAAGGWKSLDAGPAPKLGAVDSRAPDLRARLALEGYVAPAPKPPEPVPPATASAAAGAAPPKTPPNPLEIYDAGLAAAVADFQGHHALKADGVLNPDTLAALNIPVQDRIATLDANIERARWLPDRLPPQRIEVDIAATEATLFQGGAPVLPMRAIVGDLRHHTPSFVSQVDAVVFDPPWIVPASIAAAELYPRQRRDPRYFAAHDFYVANGQLIQRAGPKASLGYIKFDMPDPFGVYLHDTPARSLFNRDRRWLSHGCMRLQMPRELATALLAPQGWRREDIDAAIAAGATRRVGLAAPTPVYVVYRTAIAEPDGKVDFRPDAYGWDARLIQVLGARP